MPFLFEGKVYLTPDEVQAMNLKVENFRLRQLLRKSEQEIAHLQQVVDNTIQGLDPSPGKPRKHR